jgi:hypothetical protein
MKSYSNTLFRTLTLVGIAVFVFVFGVSSLVSSLSSAQAKTKTAQASVRKDTKATKDFNSVKNISLNKTGLQLAVAGMHPFSTAGLQLSSVKGEKTETPKELHKKAQRRAESANGDTPVMTAQDKREILWLARIVYSETKRSNEQRLVAWVVRNRVDTGYTGRTYESVANESAQFSGLQPSDNQYEHNMSRWWASQGESWKSALKIAKEVYFAPESERPFTKTTRHFYSPISVYDKPAWASGREAVRVIQSSQNSEPRFAFYAKVR